MNDNLRTTGDALSHWGVECWATQPFASIVTSLQEYVVDVGTLLSTMVFIAIATDTYHSAVNHWARRHNNLPA